MITSASPIPASLWVQGLQQDEDAMIRVRQPAYINENLFFEYISQVFVPYLSNLLEKPEFANETAVFLTDSASPHVSERVMQLLSRNKIMTIVFPAHMTNIFKALDLVFFGALKKSNRRRLGSLMSNLSGSRSPNFFRHMGKQQHQ
jgi:hypothetical protein